MEMVEKVQNQPTISPNRINSPEIFEKGEEDRISTLPDCMLLEILSRLPSTKAAIQTGTLSKRWKHLWTSLRNLIFIHIPSKHNWSEFVPFIDETLKQSRQLKLKKFSLYTHDYEPGFNSQIDKWIRYAIRCNVEELSIELWSMYSEEAYQLHLDQRFLTNSYFTHLKLSFCTFNPTVSITWKNLKSLCICYAKLDEDLIENILSGSPVLETLVLDKCYGFSLLNITSKSVKKLVLSGYEDPDVHDPEYIIKINAPNILSLTIEDPFFFIWKVLLVDVSSLVEATMDFFIIRFTKIKEAEEEMVKGFILALPHVKELKIGSRCAGVVSRLKDKGFAFPYVKVPYDWLDGNSAESGGGENDVA